jgi:hypothetical protein
MKINMQHYDYKGFAQTISGVTIEPSSNVTLLPSVNNL